MMEMLQTIWTALTTENEVLTNIIGIPSIFIEAFVSMFLFTNLFNITSSKSKKLLYVVIVSVLGILFKFFIM